MKDVFDELLRYFVDSYSGPELVAGILTGKHVLTGPEMIIAYKNGTCAMSNALNEMRKSSLEPLNEAFLNAVQIGNLS